MEPGILIYNLATTPLIFLSAPLRLLFKKSLSPGDSPGYWAARLGVYPEHFKYKLKKMKRPIIWIHAVSVGETGVAELLIRELKKAIPEASLILSVTTKHGLAVAMSKLSGVVTVLPFPVDLPNVVSKALQAVDPDIYISIETELWPNLATFLHRRKVPLVLLNGRISSSSYRNYRATRWLWGPVLRKFTRLSMISQKHSERVISLGAPPERVLVSGNMKLAGVLEGVDKKWPEKWKKILNLSDADPVVVFGSLRAEENTWMLEVCDSLRKSNITPVAILAPRHLKRIEVLEKWLQERGVAYQRLSSILKFKEPRRSGLVLVDMMGHLSSLYSVATVAFCGGSLVPVGGHNILEPVAWGKPVFYGPYMDNFSDIQEIVEELGLGFQVGSKTELLDGIKKFLEGPEKILEKHELKFETTDFRAPLKTQVNLVKEILENKSFKRSFPRTDQAEE